MIVCNIGSSRPPLSPWYNKRFMSISSLYSRLGAPQLIAILLLLVFALQGVWFMARIPLSAMEGVYIEAGLLQLEHSGECEFASNTARWFL